MLIGADWVVVCDLISLIGGIVIGVSLMRPRRFSGSYNRRYDY